MSSKIETLHYVCKHKTLHGMSLTSTIFMHQLKIKYKETSLEIQVTYHHKGLLLIASTYHDPVGNCFFTLSQNHPSGNMRQEKQLQFKCYGLEAACIPSATDITH